MYTAAFGHFTQDYVPNGYFMVHSMADYYVLSDGSVWDSGAGFHPTTNSKVLETTIDGSLVSYTFDTSELNCLFENRDFNGGDHSAQGVLGLPSKLSLTAEIGSTTGKMSGFTKILSNLETSAGQPRFNFYSALVGSEVYFEQTYQLVDGTFTEVLFNSRFRYNVSGFVDFTNVVPEPSSIFFALLAPIGILISQSRLIIGLAESKRKTRQDARFSERTVSPSSAAESPRLHRRTSETSI